MTTGGSASLKKRDVKAAAKPASDTPQPLSAEVDPSKTPVSKLELYDDLNEQLGDELIHYKSTNSMNNMLPSLKTARDEAAQLAKLEKEKEEATKKQAKVEADEALLASKR